ncbi:MAG: EAL domain-containing protein [Actinobacteria bacterium]|nr:EAL domain-containing protein [Actinomycetota bacterium]
MTSEATPIVPEAPETAVVISSPEGMTLGWDEAAETLFGYSFEEVVGRPLSAFFVREQNEMVLLLMDKAKRNETLPDHPAVGLRRDGTKIEVALTLVPTKDVSGKGTGFSTAIRHKSTIDDLDAPDGSTNGLLRRIEELEQRGEEFELLNEMGDFLQSCSKMDEAYAVITEMGGRLFPQDSGALFVLNESKNLVERAAFWGDIPTEDVFSPESCWALRRGKTHTMVDSSSVLLCEHIGELIGECICIPLIAHGDKLGVMQLRTADADSATEADRGRGRKIGVPLHLEHGRELASNYAERIAIALSNLQLRESLRATSIRDPLTGLYNRRYLEETLERELHRAARSGGSVGVIMCDVDGFKEVNDEFGHPAGDEVLRDLGRFLQTHIRDEDLACRYGGDEFALILPDASFAITLERSQRLREAVKEMDLIGGGREIGPVSLSFGTAAFPRDGLAPAKLIGAADSALYRAKVMGKDRVVGSKALNRKGESQSFQRLSANGTEVDLRVVAEKDDLRLHFQPIVDLRDSSVVAMEALVRWDHPERGLLGPQEFIPTAELDGTIREIDKWVLREACRQTAEWRATLPSAAEMKVSVNLAASEFGDPRFLEDVVDCLRETRLDPQALQLEISESDLMGDAEANLALLSNLKNLGVELAVDNFGTGFSSLSYLGRFPIDYLKIDHTSTQSISAEQPAPPVVEAMVKMGEALQLKIVPVGLELAEQSVAVQQLGCELGQGYYFHKPQAPEQLTSLLR